jgi:glycosyltransferase involved in cell wall biosynthesis
MPNFGSFIREQSELMAKNHPEYRIIVGFRADKDLRLSFRNPFRLLYRIMKNTFSRHDVVVESKNFIEIGNPAFSLRNFPHIFTAMERDIALHSRNIRYCERRFGKINIIHAHVTNPAGFIAMKLAERSQLPFIVTEHRKGMLTQMVQEDKLGLQQFIETINKTAEIIAVSRNQAQIIKSISNCLPRVIPNMTNENKFTFNARMKSNIPFVFATLCALINNKGLHTLLQAIEHWMPVNLNVKFKIGGDGYLKKELHELAAKLGIMELIEWTGYIPRDNAPAFFNSSDVFVLPSRSESFGIVYIEALACGLPVIATRCGGPEEIVNERNGLLTEVDDHIGLANALKDMYYSYDMYDKLEIRKDFEQRFSSHSVTNQLSGIYQRLIKSK